ncbi:sodium-coupled monocarboxylate transporter 1-like [Lampetra fluviatilis]
MHLNEIHTELGMLMCLKTLLFKEKTPKGLAIVNELLANLAMDAVSGRIVGTFGVWDYVLFALMLLVSAVIGIYFATKERSNADFLMGGRQLSPVPVSVSLTASFMSAIAVLGTPVEIYRYGVSFGYMGLTYVLMVVVSAEVFLPVFYELGITSTYEYLELRFNKIIRLFGTVFYIVQTVLYTGIVIYAPALALNQVTGFNLWGSIMATGIVCTFYTTLGGLKAVVWTDVFQIGVMVAGYLAVIIQGTILQGGFSVTWERSQQGGRLDPLSFHPDPRFRHTFWSVLVGGTFVWTTIYGVNQSQVQRYLACKTQRQAKLALYLNLLGLWIILACSVLCGLVMYAQYADCDPLTAGLVSASDQLMPFLVMDILSDFPGVPGLFVSSAFSGTLSTVSSSINALAAVTLEDLIKPRFLNLPEKRLSLVSKGLSVGYGVICIAMAVAASGMGSILQAALMVFGILGGPMLGVFVLGIIFPCSNDYGATAGLAAGFLLALWVGVGAQFYPPPADKTLPLPLNTSGCLWLNQTDSLLNETIVTLLAPTSNGLPPDQPAIASTWYSLSYLYYSAVGTLGVVIVGMFVSVLTGGRKGKEVSPSLLVRSCLPCSWRKSHSDTAVVEKVASAAVPSKPLGKCHTASMGTTNPSFDIGEAI